VAARVDGLVPLAHVRFADPAVRFGGQHQPGRVGVHGPWYLRSKHEADDQFTGCQRGAPIVVSQQNWCDRNGFGDRAGHTPASQPFQCDDQVDRVRVDAVEPFRDR
jgi:hypothetical protein